MYCSRECQAASWRDKECPHRVECKSYCENVAPVRGASDPGPIPIALAGIHLIDSDKILDMAMMKRTIAFLDEVARVCDEPKVVGISIAVMWNFGMARLQGSARFVDGDANIVDTNIILFKSVSKEDRCQQMIHPRDGGAGDLYDGAKKKVIHHLVEFFREARERGIDVRSVTCGRATLWLCEREWKEKLIAGNGGDGRLMIMRSSHYLSA